MIARRRIDLGAQEQRGGFLHNGPGRTRLRRRAPRGAMTGHAFRTVNARGAAPMIFICDHASNRVPPEIGDLGIDAAEMQRHIAWDIGAAAVTELLAQRFDAPAFFATASRLVIDCNRNWGDPGLMREISDGTPIPANRGIGAAEKKRRWDVYHQAYHTAIDAAIEAKLEAGQRPKIVAIHSMTPAMKGVLRPWQIAMCAHEERGLNDRVLAELRRNAGIVVGDNEPYNLDPREDFSIPHHAMRRGLPHLQVEFRQDEIDSPAGQARWAAIFATAIQAALAESR